MPNVVPIAARARTASADLVHRRTPDIAGVLHLADARAERLGEPREPLTVCLGGFTISVELAQPEMQALGVPIEVTERVINHLSGETAGIKGVYKLYEYSDEKRSDLD